MADVVDLVDRAVVLPPGPELSAVLGGLSWEKIPNARLVEVVRARSRQLAHDHAELLAGLVEITHAVAVADLPGGRSETVARVVARVGKGFEWACHEIAAGLTWTPTAADRELGFATGLVQRLPAVFTALQQGRIDRGKAQVFLDHLDPANGDVTAEQARLLVARFLGQAPEWTRKQLSDRLYRALHAIDPGLRRRRYERAVRERGVALYLDPRTGTATLVGDGLSPDEAAAAGERIDRLVETAKRAGHPGRRPQISADLYLGMLNGTFHRLTEAQIIAALLAAPRAEDNPHPDTADTDPPTGDPPAGEAGAGDRVATREGIEIRVGLATLAGLDDRPGEIAGLGPVGAALARPSPAGTRCWPRSPPAGPTATTCVPAWPRVHVPGSPAAPSPSTSECVTATAAAPAAPAPPATRTWTTPANTAAAAPPSRRTSGPRASAITPTRTAAGNSPSPNRDCSAGSAHSGGST